MEWDAESIDEHGKIPEQGDFVESPVTGEEYLVTRVDVVNESKVEAKIIPKRQNRHYNDPSDPSESWKKIDKKYLNQTNTNFLNSGLSP